MWWRCRTLVIACAAATLWTGAQAAEHPTGLSDGAEAAVRATAASFADAFNRGDAQAVAGLWTQTGTLIDDRGHRFQGRAAIEAEYAAFFRTYPGAQINVTVMSLDFLTPTVAVEDGMSQASLLHASVPVASSYTAVHVLEDGKWLMASVRERAIALSAAESRLHDLEWTIGTWVTTQDEVQLQTTFHWIANKTFIQRSYTVRQQDAVVCSGVQVIGWDPQAGQIRSWSFDSSGGYGQSLWRVTPEGWSIESCGVLADGTPTASNESLVRMPGQHDVFHWRSTDRMAGSNTLPDAGNVVMNRVADK
ncbi:MAG: YybH family protein [Pirellulaceae bacterium]